MSEITNEIGTFPIDMSAEIGPGELPSCNPAEYCGRWARGAIQLDDTKDGREATVEFTDAGCTECSFQSSPFDRDVLATRRGLNASVSRAETVEALMGEAWHAMELKVIEIDKRQNG